MSVRSAVGRLAEMDREEVRFRTACEARKLADRVRHAIAPPRWDRRDLAGALDPDSGPLVASAAAAARRHDYRAAQAALAEHFRTRDSRWPLQARRRSELTTAIARRFPDACREARVRADRIVAGRLDLLGYRDVAIGSPPQWHADPVHQRKAPMGFWAAVPYLNPAFGDHKVIWEINRHQYFLSLGTAYWLTGDPKYRATFIAHFQDWLRDNPPLRGVNWSSMLELAFRVLSWTWAVEFFAGEADADETPWLVDLLVAVDRQLTHVSQNLSSYFSPNTHLSGEALGLYAASSAFPELRRSRARAATGRTILTGEALTQVRADGGHAELSPHYHRYSADFYLLALMVARAADDGVAAAFEQAACKQARYLRTMADDRGRFPSIGDEDGGQLFRFAEVRPGDASLTLSVAASLLDEGSLAVGAPTEESCWILGHVPDAGRRSQLTGYWPSRLLPDSGYMVSRTADGGHLVFDAGPHGFLNGGHAHADALSVVLTVGGDPLLVDPGTATYTMNAQVRDRFRSSRMHNTLILDGRDHATPSGPFQWATRADSRFLTARLADGFDFAVGAHDGYAGEPHLRAVLAIPALGWLIVDRIVTSRPVEAQVFWHLHPDWRATRHGLTVDLRHRNGRHLALATTARELTISEDRELSAYAPEYGRIEPATTLVARDAGAAPFAIGTFIPARDVGTGSVDILPGEVATAMLEGWVRTTFAIRTYGDDFEASIYFPENAEAQPGSDWPQPCITGREVSRVS